MVTDRAFIFHMCIPYGKTSSPVLRSRSSVKVKVKYQGHSFLKKKWMAQGHLCFERASCSLLHMLFNALLKVTLRKYSGIISP